MIYNEADLPARLVRDCGLVPKSSYSVSLLPYKSLSTTEQDFCLREQSLALQKQGISLVQCIYYQRGTRKKS